MKEAAHIEATAPPADGRRRLTDAERRGVIVHVAETVFLEQGYAAANMDDVARGARMSKKTLYRAFPSKEALFEAVLMDHLEPLMVSMPDDEGEDPRTGLNAVLLRAVQQLLDPKQIGMFRLVCAEGKRYPELARAMHRAGPGRGEGALERCLRMHAEKGRLRVEDPHEAATMLFGMAIGALHFMLILNLREQPEVDEIAAQVSKAVDMFLRANEVRPAEEAGCTPRARGRKPA